MHERQHFAHVHISKDLAKKLGIKMRSIGLRKGDTVRVMVGKNRGKSGKVNEVDLKTGRVLIDGINKKNAKGKELPISIYSSNLSITDLNLTDKLRNQKIESAKKQEAKQPQPIKQQQAQPARKV
jgi:large subunit ribosomal protein L24